MQVVVDLSRAAAIADMRPSRVAVIGSILQVRACARVFGFSNLYSMSHKP